MSSEASTLLGLLADDDRLRTVAALVLGSGPATASEVAATAGLGLAVAELWTSVSDLSLFIVV